MLTGIWLLGKARGVSVWDHWPHMVMALLATFVWYRSDEFVFLGGVAIEICLYLALFTLGAAVFTILDSESGGREVVSRFYLHASRLSIVLAFIAAVTTVIISQILSYLT